MKIYLRLIVASLILAFSILADAQSDFRRGYIITNDDDTLVGFIDFRGYTSNSQKCGFKPAENAPPSVFNPGDIKAYRIMDDKYYVSRPVETEEGQKEMFLEYLIKGEASIYYYRDNKGEHYLIDKRGGPLTELPYHKEEAIIDEVPRFLESTKHIGLLKAYMSDCPALFNRIESLKKPDHDNLIALAKDYHQLICNDNSCIVYSKRKPALGVAAEPAVIFNWFRYGTGIYTGTGISLHFWLPRSSERLYFRTGYMYTRGVLYQRRNDEMEWIGIERSIHRIPVQFEYLVPGRVVQPRFNYGINLIGTDDYDKAFDQTAGAGLLVKVYNQLYISGGVEADWTPILLSLMMDFDIELVSLSLNFGLYYRF